MILFEWDEAKARQNIRKHGVDFELAKDVFVDPHALTEQDRAEAGELRWRTIGLVGGTAVLFVAHTIREHDQHEIYRIISARRASRRERNEYEQNREKDAS